MVRPPFNLDSAAVPWARGLTLDVDTLIRDVQRMINDTANGNKGLNASINRITAQQNLILAQQAALKAQQDALAAQQTMLSAQQTALGNAQTAISTTQQNIISQQNYLNSLQPVSAAVNSGVTQVAPGSWGSVRPSVSLRTAAGGRIQISVSAFILAPGSSLYGVFSVSGDYTVTRASRVAGNEVLRSLSTNGGSTYTWIIGVPANADISVAAEFYSDPGNSVSPGYGYPTISVQNVA